MFKRFSKFLVALLLFTYSYSLPGTSYALAPLVIPVVVSAILHVGGAAGLYYWLTQGGKNKVNDNGNVQRPTNVAWVDLTATPPAVVNKNINANLSTPNLENLATKTGNETKYPGLAEAVKKYDDNPPPNFGAMDVGAKFTYAGKSYRVTGAGAITYDAKGTHFEDYQFHGVGTSLSFTYTPLYNGHYTAAIVNDPGQGKYRFFQKNEITGSFTADWVWMQPVEEIPATWRLKTAVELKKDLAKNGISGEIQDSFQAELDKMFQDPDYVPVFSDATTGLPFEPPPQSSVMTPEQLTAYNNSIIAKNAAADAAKTASTVATAQSAAAQQAATDAQNRLNIAINNYNGSPTDANKAAMDAAQAAADAAAAAARQAAIAAAQAAADAAKQDSEVAQDEGGVTAPSGMTGKYGDTQAYDFGVRTNDFFTAVKGSALFGLTGKLVSGIPGGGESVITVNFGSFGQKTFDLAQFSSSWAIIRSILEIMAGISAIYIVVLKGGSG